MDFDDANYQLNSEDAPRSDRQGRSAAPVDVEFRRAMRSALLPHAGEAGNADAVSSSSSKIFRFGRSPNAAQSPGFDESRFRSALEVIADLNADDGASQRCSALARPVPTKPSRILDAPDIVDDYYLNLLSWSSTNILAVALANNVYLWNASTNEVSELLQLDVGDVVTSVAWAPGGTHLCVGTDSASVQLWDASRTTLVRSMHGHSARVGALAWNPQSRCLNSGSRDALILQHDARAQRHRTATLVGHQQEVCGLSWAADGGTLASGGNENYLCLWDAARSGAARGPEVSPRCVLRQHQAAVKALSWCPSHRNLLASGGGTADRSIKFWNAHTGALLNSVDTGSQVCALLWSRHHKELVSSHGFSQNQLCLWRYPSMQKVCELTGHTARVLHLAQSPDGRTVVSAAADETLRFWSVFGGPSENRKAAVQHLGAVGAGLAIR
ncbi:WD40-repeat-containing domain protein [Pelagophyceae sp. CCMP2097]|nr:WD40-repeat-containing domain protein [Pelagophyceae sp. CCMP2097]